MQLILLEFAHRPFFQYSRKRMTEKIVSVLTYLDIPHRSITHEAVFSVEESLELLVDKFPLKNLLLQEEKGRDLFLVVMAGEQKLNTRQLARTVGARNLRFAEPEILKAKLGVSPGSVSLFGLLHPHSDGVKLIVDKEIIDEPELGFHPNDNTQTIFIPGSAIEQLVQHTGHEYKIVQLYQ